MGGSRQELVLGSCGLAGHGCTITPLSPSLPAGNRKENTVPCSNCKTQLRFDAQTREVEVAEEAKA